MKYLAKVTKEIQSTEPDEKGRRHVFANGALIGYVEGDKSSNNYTLTVDKYWAKVSRLTIKVLDNSIPETLKGRIVPKMKEFIIDLQSFIVEAENEDEAKEKAIMMLKTGEVVAAIDSVVEDTYEPQSEYYIAGICNRCGEDKDLNKNNLCCECVTEMNE